VSRVRSAPRQALGPATGVVQRVVIDEGLPGCL
jgi:hypothetical protein